MTGRHWIFVALAVGWLAACASDEADLPEGSVSSVAGAYFGRGVDADLDPEDKVYMLQTAQVALEFNRIWEISEWLNRKTGSRGTVMPVRTYRNSVGQYCREYRATVTIDDENEEMQVGHACRDGDGLWRLGP